MSIAGIVTVIDYCGETEFYNGNGSIKYLHTEEGLVEYQSVSSFAYEYFLKDHLGNTRAVVSADGSGNIVLGQVDSYYAFGMVHTGIPTISNPGSDNKYLYNGKELQDENLGGVNLDWYDYGARFYDPQIGRWHTIDLLTDLHTDYTPYAYCYNNPIKLIDPFGLDSTYYNGSGSQLYQTTGDKGKTSFNYVTKTTKTTDEMLEKKLEWIIKEVIQIQ